MKHKVTWPHFVLVFSIAILSLAPTIAQEDGDTLALGANCEAWRVKWASRQHLPIPFFCQISEGENPVLGDEPLGVWMSLEAPVVGPVEAGDERLSLHVTRLTTRHGEIRVFLLRTWGLAIWQ